jgi:stalled ribosome rescue protein Dom34
MKRKHGYKRGYPIAILLGFEDNRVVLWQVFSHVVKPQQTVEITAKRTDQTALYNFHESVVAALRPMLNEGIRSIVVTSPLKATYAEDFLDHVRKHHTHLIQPKNLNRATFAKLTGSADQPHAVAVLVRTKEFRELIRDTTSDEADHIVDAFEKNLYNVKKNPSALFSLREIEDAFYSQEVHEDLGTEYLMLTDKYLAGSKDKNEIQRLLQISKNRKVKTRIVKAETPAGKRISQFGGIIFFTIAAK